MSGPRSLVAAPHATRMHVDTGGNDAPASDAEGDEHGACGMGVRQRDDGDDGRGMHDAGRRHQPAGAAAVDETALRRPRHAAGDRHRAHHRAGQRQRPVVAPDDQDDPDGPGALSGLSQQPAERLPAHRRGAQQDTIGLAATRTVCRG